MSRGELHAVCGHFLKLQMDRDLSGRQEWLWSSILSELEYRNRRALKRDPRYTFCACEHCLGPFLD